MFGRGGKEENKTSNQQSFATGGLGSSAAPGGNFSVGETSSFGKIPTPTPAAPASSLFGSKSGFGGGGGFGAQSFASTAAPPVAGGAGIFGSGSAGDFAASSGPPSRKGPSTTPFGTGAVGGSVGLTGAASSRGASRAGFGTGGGFGGAGGRGNSSSSSSSSARTAAAGFGAPSSAGAKASPPAVPSWAAVASATTPSAAGGFGTGGGFGSGRGRGFGGAAGSYDGGGQQSKPTATKLAPRGGSTGGSGFVPSPKSGFGAGGGFGGGGGSGGGGGGSSGGGGLGAAASPPKLSVRSFGGQTKSGSLPGGFSGIGSGRGAAAPAGSVGNAAVGGSGGGSGGGGGSFGGGGGSFGGGDGGGSGGGGVSGGGSFADAAKRALTPSAWSRGDRSAAAPATAAAPKASAAKGFRTNSGFGTSSTSTPASGATAAFGKVAPTEGRRRTFADGAGMAASLFGKGRVRGGAGAGAGGVTGAPMPASTRTGQSALRGGLPWAAARLPTTSESASPLRSRAGLAASADGGGGGSAADRVGRRNAPPTRGTRTESSNSGSRVLGAYAAGPAADATGRSKIMGGFGSPPPGSSSGPPAFIGGGGGAGRGGGGGGGVVGGGGGGKAKTSRASATGRSRILGGFGAPTADASSDPPAFVGGGAAGSGSGRPRSGRAPPAAVAAPAAAAAGGSRIMGGFGASPPGGDSSEPPAFAGGGGGGGGGGSDTRLAAASGLNAADDVAAKNRRAQRFGGASGGGGGSGGGESGRTRGGGGGGGGGGSSGAGGENASAEDVQRGSHLDDAEIKVGTVEGMCPLEEMSRRVPGDLHILEKEHPALLMPAEGGNGGTPPRPWSNDELVVKRHQRAAAGMDISKPELLRTPQWLARTVDHLVANCMDKGPQGGGDPDSAWEDPRIQEYLVKFRANNPSRAESAEEETEHDLYNFVWDRFRMIRSDYNMQGYNAVVGLVSEASVVAHERMARWYVLMANRMEKNTMQTHRFNLKSIVETLKKLYEFYTILVARGEVTDGLASPNEPEIMAYYLLTVLEQDDGVEVQRLVKDLVRSRREKVLESPEIKGALRVVRAWHAGDYVAFFRALRQQGVMHRCLLSQYVKSMRDTAINVIAVSFYDFSASELMRLLCFEDEDQMVAFLGEYNLRVSSSGQVLLREKDQSGTWVIPFLPPDNVPEPPPLQDLVEPKPWRKASEWVCKGDFERAADKSHGAAAAAPLRAGGGGARSGSAVASVLRRATSSSSSAASSPLSVGGRLKAKVAGRSSTGVAGAAAAAAATIGTGPNARQSSSTRPPSAASLSTSPPPPPASSSFPARSPAGVPTVPTPSGDGAGFASGAAGTTPAIGFASRDTGAAFTFGPPAAMYGAATAAAAASGISSDHQASPAAPQPAVGASASPAPAAAVSSVGGFVFAARASDSTSGRGAQDAPAGFGALGSGAPTSSPAFDPSGGTKRGATGGGSAAPGTGSGSHPPSGVEGVTVGGGGAAAVSATAAAEAAKGSSDGKSLLSNFTFTSAPAATTKSGNSAAPAATGGAGVAAGNAAKSRAAYPQGFERASGGGFPFAPAASYGAAAAAAPGTALGVSAGKTAASAAAAQHAADEVAARARNTKRQQEDAEARREKQRQTEEAASRREAVAAAAREARRVRDAEGRAMRALSCGKLVPSDVVDQLPPNGSLHRAALEGRKILGLRLARLSPAFTRRKRRAAWTCWLGETKRSLEEQHLVALRNRRFEEHSVLTENASFLQRNKKRRSHSSHAAGAPATDADGKALALRRRAVAAAASAAAVSAAAAAAAMLAAEARGGDAPDTEDLRKPDPLDLSTILAPGLAKNQGADAEEAFRAVGLTTVQKKGMSAAAAAAAVAAGMRSDGSVMPVEEPPLSPPHLFWKAVVVAPARTRGNVGAWLDAKFGGGGGAEGVARYARDVASQGLCPAPREGAGPGMEDHDGGDCGGSSGASKLIYRALRELPKNAFTGPARHAYPRQWMHLCVKRVSVGEGCRLRPSPELSETLKAASVLVFAASPRDQDRFFWSPLHPTPDWSHAREDLRHALDASSLRGNDGLASPGVPLLVVIPVKDSALQRGTDGMDSAASERTRAKILEDASEGLGLSGVAERGFSLRVALVGLHEFESRSKAAAASGEGLAFAGKSEKSCSEDVAAKLAELAGQAPKQPLIATRSLQEMLNTAVARATTDDRYADAVGLALPECRYEDPPLHAVIAAASHATRHVCSLLSRRSDAWPMREFAVRAGAGALSGDSPGAQRVVEEEAVEYVPGAARPASGEIAVSPLAPPEGAIARLRGSVQESGGLTLDWAAMLPRARFANPVAGTDAAAAADAAAKVTAVVEAATFLPVPVELAEAFGPDALAGKGGSRPLGREVACARVRQLEAYLGGDILPGDLRYRLADALAAGVMMRGAPPPWRALVRDAVARKIMLAGGERGGGGGTGGRPLVVHFVAASGQERLKSTRDGVVVPGLLGAEDFRASAPESRASELARDARVLTPSRDPTGNEGGIVARVSATLKRVAPLIAHARPTESSNKHRRTNSCTNVAGGSGGGGGGSGGEGDTKRRYVFDGSGNSKLFVESSAMSDAEEDDIDRQLRERVGLIALETEKVRSSRERAASAAAADHDLDEAFLKSWGVSLAGAGAADGNGLLPSAAAAAVNSAGGKAAPFDRTRVTSLPLGLTEGRKENSEAEHEEHEFRRRRAAATLSPAEYKCWVIREEIDGYRRQEEKMRSEIFNGDPLLPLWTGPAESGPREAWQR